MIAICILFLMCGLVFACYLFSNNNVQDVSLQIVMQVDSTGVLTEESLHQVEDLKAELVRHEQLLEDRYKHVLVQKENLNDLLTIGGMFLTTILALFGFFGYKSMTTLEEKVKEDALSAVGKTVKKTVEDTLITKFETFKQSAKESLGNEMKTDVKNTINREMGREKSLLDAKLIDLESRVNQKIDEQGDPLTVLRPSIDNLNQKLTILDDKVKTLEMSSQLKGRRTLRNGGNQE